MKKYFSKIAAGMVLVAMFIMTGCTEDTSVNYSDSVIKVIGTLHGVVTNAANNARIEGVTVTVTQQDIIHKAKTDSLGYYIVKNLDSGSYVATFEIDGYAVTKSVGYIPTEEEVYEAKVDINQVEILDMGLFTLNAGVTGKLYKVISDGNVVAASGVTVIADFDHFDLSPNEYTATTNASGVYTFSNLPAAPMVSLRTLPYNDGTYSFDPIFTSAELIPGVTVTAMDGGLEITEAPVFVLTHNILDGFAITGNIVMTFNKAIDPATFKAYLGIDKASKTEITSITWTNNNTTVTINPDEDLRIETWYYFYCDGRSADGNYFEEDYSFQTQEGIEILKTNMQLYDEYYSITATQDIIVEFSLPTVSSSYNYFRIRSYDVDGNYVGDITTDVTVSWSSDKKTLTVTAPASPGYVLGQIRLEFVYYSNTVQYDYVEFDEYIDIR